MWEQVPSPAPSTGLHATDRRTTACKSLILLDQVLEFVAPATGRLSGWATRPPVAFYRQQVTSLESNISCKSFVEGGISPVTLLFSTNTPSKEGGGVRIRGLRSFSNARALPVNVTGYADRHHRDTRKCFVRAFNNRVDDPPANQQHIKPWQPRIAKALVRPPGGRLRPAQHE